MNDPAQYRLWSIPGDGVLARQGNLVLLISIEDRGFAESLLELLTQTSEAGGGGRALGEAIGAAVERHQAWGGSQAGPSILAFGPAGGGLAFTVSGGAFVEISTSHGKHRLVAGHPSMLLNSVVAVPVLTVRGGLGGTEPGDRTDRFTRLDSGTVRAWGLSYAAPAGPPGAPAATSPAREPRQATRAPAAPQAQPAAPVPVAAPAPAPAAQPRPPGQPVVHAPAAAPGRAAPPARPAPPSPAAPPAREAPPAQVAPHAEAGPPAQAGPPAHVGPFADPPFQDEHPAAAGPFADESAPPPLPPAEPRRRRPDPGTPPFGTDPAAYPPPGQGFEEPGPDDADGPGPGPGLAARYGLGLDEPGVAASAPAPQKSPGPAEDPDTLAGQSAGAPIVMGVYCKNGHFTDPDARSCMMCGSGIRRRSAVTERGPRPTLGVLILEDGAAVAVDGDYVIGRDPARDESVSSGAARPLRVVDAESTVSRIHAEVHLEGWQVLLTDLGSANGTRVQQPGATTEQMLEPKVAVPLQHGSRIFVGASSLRYEREGGQPGLVSRAAARRPAR